MKLMLPHNSDRQALINKKIYFVMLIELGMNAKNFKYVKGYICFSVSYIDNSTLLIWWIF